MLGPYYGTGVQVEEQLPKKAILAPLPFHNNLENMYLKLSQVPYMYNSIITT